MKEIINIVILIFLLLKPLSLYAEQSIYMTGMNVMDTPTDLFSTDLHDVRNKENNKFPVVLNQEQSFDNWQVTNDGVMGGLSVGKIELEKQYLIFSGYISTENNGGFTSVFKQIPNLPSEVESININIIGDGKRYQLRVRSQVMGYDLAYKVHFETKQGIVENHTFKLADFKASFRGRTLADAPSLDATKISHVGFLVTAQNPQYFYLSVRAIDFY